MTRPIRAVPPPDRPVGNGLRAVGAALTLVLLVVGIPVLLGATIGNPLPGWRDLIAGDVSDAAVIAVLVSIAWAAWAQFTVAVVVETVCQVVRVPLPRRIPGVLSGQQHLARTLVTAVLILLPALAPVAGMTEAASASTISHPTGHVATAPVLVTGTAQARTPAATPQARSSASPAKIVMHTVTKEGPGTYWDLARHYLGAGERWREIWHLNEGHRQDDGAVMTSPDLLRPGWVIRIPDDGRAAPEGAGDAVTVRPGDTLSEIAQQHSATWTHLWSENRGRVEPGGDRFTDPEHIEPGWRIATGSGALSAPDRGEAPDRSGRHVGAEHAKPSVGADQRATPPAAQAHAPAEHGPSRATQGSDGQAQPVVTPSLSAQASLMPRSLTEHQDSGLPAAKDQKPTPRPAPVGTQSPAARASSPAAAPGAVERHASRSSSVAAHALGPGAGLLAASALIALLRYRRRQFRHRLPGQTIAATPAELVAMEKILLRQGSESLADVAWLDQALRDLAQQVTAAGQTLPDVVAVRINQQMLELVIAEPGAGVQPAGGWDAAPGAWVVDLATGRWQLRREDHVLDSEDERERRRRQFAPYPTLVSIGYSDDGDYWLLDLEHAGVVTLTGDRDRCLDLARFVAAELAHNRWSEQLQVDLVGFGVEVEAINPERVSFVPQAPRTLARWEARLRTNRETLSATGLRDALQGRQQDVAADQWMPQVLLIDPVAADTDSVLRGLVSALNEQVARSAVSVVLAAPAGDGQPAATSGWSLTVDAAGRLEVPALGLQLNAQQLPASEAVQLAALLAATAQVQGQDMPAAHGQRAWDALANAVGSPVQQLTVADRSGSSTTAARAAQSGTETIGASIPRIRLAPASGQPDPAAIGDASEARPPAASDPRPVDDAANSVLPQPIDSLLKITTTTRRDVQVLAPMMTPTARRQVEDADPGLDHDLAAWHAPDSVMPRLSLLGPLHVRTIGTLPTDRPRVAWHTEVVAYLAARPRGVTAEQFGTDLWPNDPDIASKSKLRQAVHLVRRWLGEDPETGSPYLPSAMPGPGGVALYRVDGLLTDADLFRRLRLRGVARGTDGVSDLEAALSLVTGPPFDQRRPGGYAWLADLSLDHEFTSMIVDVAHLVATHHLANGQPGRAAAAAHVSMMAGSHDDIALLDLVAACDAEGNHAEAGVWIQRILANHDAEVEEDLPPRTAEILHRRRWIDQAS